MASWHPFAFDAGDDGSDDEYPLEDNYEAESGAADDISERSVDDELELPSKETRSLLGQAAISLHLSRERNPEYGQHVHITAGLVGAGGEKLGTMEAHLINRDRCTRSDNFYCVCDEHSSELQAFATRGFNVDGSIRPAIACKAQDGDMASSGGVLYVFQVELEKHLRGHDLGILFMDAVMRRLRHKFTIAGLFPAAWSDAERDQPRPSLEDLEAGPPREYLEELEAKKLKVARQFSRLGFKQIGHSGYMFMEAAVLPAKFAPLGKDDPAVPEFKLEPIVTAAEANALKLHKEAANGDAVDVRRELAQGGHDVNAADGRGVTALHIAASRHKPDLVRILLGAGANPLATTWEGHTPLMSLRQAMQSTKDFGACFSLEWNRPVDARDDADVRQCETLLTVAEAERQGGRAAVRG